MMLETSADVAFPAGTYLISATREAATAPHGVLVAAVRELLDDLARSIR